MIDRLSSFEVRITDDRNNLINFNGISSYFSFQFDYYRFYIPKTLGFHQIIEEVARNQKPEQEF